MLTTKATAKMAYDVDFIMVFIVKLIIATYN